MCHKNFEVKFTGGLNCISGNNGCNNFPHILLWRETSFFLLPAGKSCLLLALKLAMGATAKKSHRADKNGDLVGDHAERAKISVCLNNRGFNKYKHDVFGDSITVVRTITKKTGASSYQMLGEGRFLNFPISHRFLPVAPHVSRKRQAPDPGLHSQRNQKDGRALLHFY